MKNSPSVELIDAFVGIGGSLFRLNQIESVVVVDDGKTIQVNLLGGRSSHIYMPGPDEAASEMERLRKSSRVFGSQEFIAEATSVADSMVENSRYELTQARNRIRELTYAITVMVEKAGGEIHITSPEIADVLLNRVLLVSEDHKHNGVDCTRYTAGRLPNKSQPAKAE